MLFTSREEIARDFADLREIQAEVDTVSRAALSHLLGEVAVAHREETSLHPLHRVEFRQFPFL